MPGRVLEKYVPTADELDGRTQAMQQIGESVGLAILVSIAAGHGQSGALEGAAGFAVVAFALTAAALSGRAAHR